ncbi:hypothetical protein CCP2SC5_1640004 [Azospirillaceae bacterium]
MLNALGCRRTHQAEDGVSGLEAVRAYRLDIILCDVEMRPIDGLGFLSGLREDQDEALRRLPVIFVTNRIAPAVVDTASAYDAHSFLAKPVSAAILKDHMLHNIQKKTS